MYVNYVYGYSGEIKIDFMYQYISRFSPVEGKVMIERLTIIQSFVLQLYSRELR